MNLLRKSLLVLLCFAPLGLRAEKPPVATVNMQKLFAEYHVAVERRGSIDSLRDRLKDDPRMKSIADSSATLQALQKTIRDPATPESEKESLFAKFQDQRMELKSLQRDTQQHIDTEQAKINAQLVEMTRTLLAEIREAVSLVAKKEGYQLVLESEGHTSSQVPTLLYIRHGDDITALVLSHLNKGHETTEPALSGAR